jgi:hypothetical protein
MNIDDQCTKLREDSQKCYLYWIPGPVHQGNVVQRGLILIHSNRRYAFNRLSISPPKTIKRAAKLRKLQVSRSLEGLSSSGNPQYGDCDLVEAFHTTELA